jgi:hypothetical protein
MQDPEIKRQSAHSTTRTREAAIRELECLLASAEELRTSLRTTEVVYRKALKTLKSGKKVSESLRNVQAGAVRQALNAKLESFELVRHRSRLTLIAAGLREGMTIGELGRAWGFSRQLASRYAKEARGQLRAGNVASTSSGV